MRALKILTVATVMTASVVVGVTGTASAAPPSQGHGQQPTLWCC